MSTLYSIYNAYESMGMEVPEEIIEALADEERESAWENWAEAMMNLPPF